jgi:hypothetical protein
MLNLTQPLRVLQVTGASSFMGGTETHVRDPAAWQKRVST